MKDDPTIELAKRTRAHWMQTWWSLVAIVVASACVAGLCIFYTNQQQRESDRRWCELFASLDQPQEAATPRGREIQRQIHNLREDMGCEIT